MVIGIKVFVGAAIEAHAKTFKSDFHELERKKNGTETKPEDTFKEGDFRISIKCEFHHADG